MSSWVRYSITVYIGLLISGSLAQMPKQVPADPPGTHPSAHQDEPSHTPAAIPQAHKPTKIARSDDPDVIR